MMESNNYSNVTFAYYDHNFTYYDFNFTDDNYTDGIYYPYYAEPPIMYVITCVIISIGLPLTLVAIYALYSQVSTL